MRRLLLAVVALGTLACSSPAPDRRLVVLAVDGLDPEVTERLIRTGRIPHLAALAGDRGVVRVTPSPGAESFSSWTSLITGTNPGAHGIFDMVTPDRRQRPAMGPLEPRPASRWFGRWWAEGAAFTPVRRGDPFWTHLGRAGIHGTVLFVPSTFPPQAIPAGTLVAGTPLPDWSGAPGSSYTWLASNASAAEVGPTRYGGRVVALDFVRNVAETTIAGLRTPDVQDLPLTIAHNPEERSVNINLAGVTVYLAEGQESRWIEVSRPLSPFADIRGLVRLYLARAGNEVALHVAPIEWHPASPPSAISAPARAAATLFDRLGPFHTLVWPDAGWALADGRMSEDRFVSEQNEIFSDRAEALLSTMDSGEWDLIVAGVETIDTTTRLMWRMVDPGHPAHDPELARRFGGAIDRMYGRLDELVGQVQERLAPDDDLAVVSPYGVYTARHLVDLNRWLTDEGLLAWREPPAPVTLGGLTDPSLWGDTVDWSATRARAMGAGHIYINLRGRDPSGTVEPGADYDRLVATLTERLLALTDPLSGRRVVSRVRSGTEAFPGPDTPQKPDLVVSFTRGYRMSWDSMLGGLSARVIAPNLERWSAEHASMDESAVPGVWLSTIPVAADTVDVMDIAPTLVDHFGRPPLPGAEGASRLDAGDAARR